MLPALRPTALAPWLAVAAAVLALLWEPLANGRALAPYDALGAFEPWASETDLAPSNPLLLDQPLVTLPWLAFFAERLHAGELPLWNPSNYLGQPVHAALTGGLMWPLHWPFLAWPDWRWLTVVAAIELLLAGGFAHLFLRRLGLSAPASTAGGIGYALCGFQVVWLGHPHVHAALLLPLGLLAVERLCAGGSDRRARTDAAVVALVTFGWGVGGHAQTAFHCALWLGAYAALRACTGPRPRLGRRGAVRLALGAFAGLLLASPQVLPFLEYLRLSRADALFASEDPVAAVAAWKPAVMLLDPWFFGDPLVGTYRGPVGDNLNFSELAGGHVGRVLLALALVGAVAALRARGAARDGRHLLALAAVAVGASLAFQVPGVYDLARQVPVLASTKLMRFALLLALGLVVLGAVGLDRLLAAVPERVRRPLGIAVVLAVAAELVAFGRGFNPSIEPERVFAPTPTTAHLAAAGGRALGTEGTTLAPNANLPLGVSMPTGYDSIELDRVTDLVGLLTTDERAAWFLKEVRYFDRAVPLARALGIAHVVTRTALPEPYRPAFEGPGGLRVYDDPGALGRVWVARGAEVVVDETERLARLAAADLDPLLALVESEPPADARVHDAPPGSARVVVDEPRRLVVECQASAPALLVVADAHYPGWRATIDGEPVAIEPVDHALRGVWLAPGASRVEMVYEPGSFRLGLVLGGLGLALVAALVLLPRPRP